MRAAFKHLRGDRAPESMPLPVLSTSIADRAVSEGCFVLQGSFSSLPLREPPLLLPSSGSPATRSVVIWGPGLGGVGVTGLWGEN